MLFLEHLENIFNTDIKKYEENFKEVNIILLIDWKENALKYITELEEILLNSDDINLKIEVEIEDNVLLNKIAKKEEFIRELNNKIELLEESMFKTSICIKKNDSKNRLSIYNILNFFEWLNTKNIYEQMYLFSERLRKLNTEQFKFICFELNEIYCTESIILMPNKVDINNPYTINRDEFVELSKKSTSFLQINDLCLLPQDFNFKTKNSGIVKVVQVIFDKLKLALALTYLSDYACFERDNLFLRINGYRIIEENINIKLLPENLKNGIYNIYEWVYGENNVIDKIQLAKNIISLHCKYCNIIDTDEKTFSSIKANFELYIRGNVEKYLESKRDYTKFLLSIISEIENHVDELIISIKKNIGAGLTFIIGLIFSNAFSNKKLDNIFTEDITAMTCMVLMGSLVYAVFSIIDTVLKYSRSVKRLDEMKISYSDIISEKELTEIFENNLDLDKVKARFLRWTKVIGSLWLFLLVSAFLCVAYLSDFIIWPF